MNLNPIPRILKLGSEKIIGNTGQYNLELLDFWRWNQSDILSNSLRGHFAEFLVKCALNIPSPIRVEWDNYDLITKSGKAIEVKSAAYIQSWEQKRYSSIRFSIKTSQGARDHPKYDMKYRRWGDYYVFSLLKHKDPETINPLNVDQWDFYVVSAETLNKHLPTQKSISLTKLQTIPHKKCSFHEIGDAIK